MHVSEGDADVTSPERDTDITGPADADITGPEDADDLERAGGETRTSIVLPVYNEAGNVAALLEELRTVIESDAMAAYRSPVVGYPSRIARFRSSSSSLASRQ